MSEPPSARAGLSVFGARCGISPTFLEKVLVSWRVCVFMGDATLTAIGWCNRVGGGVYLPVPSASRANENAELSGETRCWRARSNEQPFESKNRAAVFGMAMPAL